MPSPWTPVALSRDVPPATVIPGQIGGKDLAIWRSASGRIATWADRCPHRGMRLSHGFVRGEALSCIYHGWSYAASGQCIRIPAHPDLAPPDAIRVPGFAAMEANGVIWASEAAEGAPPLLEGFEGFRSLTLEAAPEAVAAALGTPPGQPAELAGQAMIALLQPLKDGGTQLHLLAPVGAPAAGLVALSRAAEALRRQIETEVAA